MNDTAHTAGTIFVGNAQAECTFVRLEGQRAIIRAELVAQLGAYARVSVFTDEANVDFDAVVRSAEESSSPARVIELEVHQLSDNSRAVLESVTRRQTGQDNPAVPAQTAQPAQPTEADAAPQPTNTGPAHPAVALQPTNTGPAFPAVAQAGTTGPRPAVASSPEVTGPAHPAVSPRSATSPAHAAVSTRSTTGPAQPAVGARRKRTTSAPPEMAGTGAASPPRRRTSTSPGAAAGKRRRRSTNAGAHSRPGEQFDEPPKLAVCLGRRLVALHDVVDQTTNIGRGEECQVAIDNPTVSREHCRIEHVADRYYLVDSGASNRTLVNGKPAFREALSSGDEIQVGKYVVLFAPNKKQLPEQRIGAQVGGARSRPDATDERTYMLEKSQYAQVLDELQNIRGAHLKRLEDKEVGDPITLDKKRLLMGRGIDAEVQLEGWWRIKKHHAAIIRVDDGITEERHTIERVRGGKPVWINDETFAGRKLLRNEDVIEIGNNRFRYYASVRRRKD